MMGESRMTTKTLIIGTVLCVAALTAHAAEWRVFATGSTGSTYAIDASRITNPFGPIYRAWVKSDWTKAAPGNNFATAMTLYEVNCPMETLRTISITRYAADSTQLSTDTVPGTFTPVTPETIGEQVLFAICVVGQSTEIKKR
jgi:hypothetical protein